MERQPPLIGDFHTLTYDSGSNNKESCKKTFSNVMINAVQKKTIMDKG